MKKGLTCLMYIYSYVLYSDLRAYTGCLNYGLSTFLMNEVPFISRTSYLLQTTKMLIYDKKKIVF